MPETIRDLLGPENEPTIDELLGPEGEETKPHVASTSREIVASYPGASVTTVAPPAASSAPTVSQIAARRLATMNVQPLPETTGPAWDQPASDLITNTEVGRRLAGAGQSALDVLGGYGKAAVEIAKEPKSLLDSRRVLDILEANAPDPVESVGRLGAAPFAPLTAAAGALTTDITGSRTAGDVAEVLGGLATGKAAPGLFGLEPKPQTQFQRPLAGTEWHDIPDEARQWAGKVTATSVVAQQEQAVKQRVATGETLADDHVQFPSVAPANQSVVRDLAQTVGPELAQERVQLGEPVPLSGSSGEVHEMPNGDRVNKLNPPAQVFRDAATQQLNDPKDALDFARAVETLRPVYGLYDEAGKPIDVTVTMEDVPISSLDGAQITLPFGAPPYMILHEVAELANKLGDEKAEYVHDNNVIGSEFLNRATGDPIKYFKPEEPAPAETQDLVRAYLAQPDSGVGTASFMGAGAFNEYGANFVEHTLKPFGAEAGEIGKGIGDLLRKIGNAIYPEHGVSHGVLDEARAAVGERFRQQDALFQTAIENKVGRRVAQMSHDERVAFIDNARQGIIEDPVLKPFVEQYRQLSDALYKDIKQYKPDLNYLENRISLFWKVPPKMAPEEMAQAYRPTSSLLGNTGWQYHLTWKSIADGEANGGVLRTDNPLEYTVSDTLNELKYSTGNRIWRKMLQEGDRVPVPRGTLGPEGWKPFDLDSRLARGWIAGEETKVPVVWYVEPNAHRLLTNFLSTDMIRQNGIGSRLLRASGMDKGFLLAVPSFHAVTEALSAAGSQAMSGAVEMARQTHRLVTTSETFDPAALLKATVDVVTSPAAGPGMTVLGGKMRRFVRNPEEFLASSGGKALLQRFPEFESDMALLYPSGGRMGIQEPYRTGLVDAVRQSFANKDPAGAAVRAVLGIAPEIVHKIGGPLFNTVIPQMKLGIWLTELQDLKLQYADELASGKANLQHLSGNLWNSVEDRFGMVGYPLWFWNNTFKTVMQGAMLSLGWKGGTLRMLTKGVIGQGLELRNSVASMLEMGPNTADPTGPATVRFNPSNFEPPKITPEFKALVSTLAPYAIATTIYQYAKTQKFPWETGTAVLDTAYPRTGRLDQDGLPERMKWPGYNPGIYDMTTQSPLKTMRGSLSPILTRFLDAANNQKFHTGEFVYNKNDPGLKQASDAIRYLAFGSFPILGGPSSGSIQQQAFQRALQTHASTADLILTGMGARVASKSLDKTEFMDAIDNIYQRQLPSAKLPEQVQMQQKLAAAKQMIQEGGDPAEIVGSGDFSKNQRKQISDQRLSPYQSRFARLGLKAALEAWGHASPEEKQRYMPLLRAKVVNPKTGAQKVHVWDSYPPSEIPVIKDQLHKALHPEEDMSNSVSPE
jgi:hypothetical protein